MSDPTENGTRRMAESEVEMALFLRNVFVLTMLGAVAFVAASVYVLL